MTFLKRKSFIIVTITLVFVMAFSMLGIFIFQCTKETKTPNHNARAADLTISSYNNLRDFISDVNNGTSYSGKSVVLSNDINCGGAKLSCIGSGSWDDFAGGTINSFEGTFDGQGYTISNFTLSGGVRFQTRTIKDQKRYNYNYYYHMALFVEIGSSAVITQLKISNYSLGSPSHVSTPSGGGHSYYHNDKQSALVSNYNTRGEISKCWIAGSGSYINVASATNIMLPGSIIDGRGGSITTKNTTTGLDYSAKGVSSSIWYYATDYNSGWPILRVFIKSWKSVEFRGLDDEGPWSIGIILIPSDADNTYTSSAKTIKVYDQEMSVDWSRAPCEHYNVVWSYSDNVYTATCSAKTVKLEIYTLKNGEEKQIKLLTVNCGSKINVTGTEYEKSGAYKSIKIGSATYEETDPKYYIAGINFTSGSVIHKDTKVVITVKIKSYNVTFG